MMRYTQKDICRAFDIKRDTLRHYERMGIIEPEVAENGYRYYDDWQINLLWDCKRYQAMGFSLAQIRDMLHHDTLAEVQGLVGQRLAEVTGELELLTMARATLSHYEKMLTAVDEQLGTYWESTEPELRFVPRREMHELLLDNRLSAAGRFANTHQQLSIPCAHFPHADERLYYWGFAMPAAWYERLGGPEEGLVALPGGRCLATCVDAGERWGFSQGLFQGLLDKAAEIGARPRGMLYGYLLTRTYDDAGGYHRYVEAMLPLQG